MAKRRELAVNSISIGSAPKKSTSSPMSTSALTPQISRPPLPEAEHLLPCDNGGYSCHELPGRSSWLPRPRTDTSWTCRAREQMVYGAAQHTLHGTGRAARVRISNALRTGRRARGGRGRDCVDSVEVVRAWGQPQHLSNLAAPPVGSRRGVPIKT